MAFTASQAFDLLRTAFSRNRLPHALLIVGDEYQGASRLILQLLELMNGIRADHLDSVRDEYCRLVRPKSKSRRILRDDIRAVEPFLQQRAAEGKWKIAVFMDAERMNDEAANAFLKTLEEPPGQCLLILSTSQPDQLLQTIISRCVRVNLLQSGEFRLTPIQEALLPHWLETCRNLNNDLAALAFRSRFMEVMAEAKAAIMEQFGFDDPQADAIVKLQLGRLAGLEILKIEEELSGLQAKIEDWEDILAHDARVLEIVKNELLDMKKRFGDERRTEIQSVTGEVDIEDLIAEEQCVYTLTEAGYIKRQLKATYQAQKRGGRGISGMTRKEEDIVQEMFVGSTHDYVLFVTDRGRLFRVKGYTISEGSRTSKGSNIVNLLQLAEGEKVTNMLCYPKDEDNKGGFVTMVTKQGLIKRTPLEQYANIRKTGLIGIALNEGDALAWTRLTTGNDMLIVATRNGQAIRFNEADARPMGRSGHGVRAIKLAEGDEVVGVCICREGGTVLTVTENGKGRRSDIDTYRITARGGKGIRNYDASKDKVAAVKIVDDIDDVLLSSQEGIIIRLHANEIPVQSRYGSGVRVMRLGENDKVMVLARTDHDDEAQTESIESDAEDEPTAEQLAEMEAADEASAAEAPEADVGDEE